MNTPTSGSAMSAKHRPLDGGDRVHDRKLNTRHFITSWIGCFELFSFAFIFLPCGRVCWM